MIPESALRCMALSLTRFEMARVPCWQVDAFTDRPFHGNPAAVCWLELEASTDWMQAVAAEMNLSETAFVRKLDRGHELRWFTPEVEVDLCGHATLAAAHALWTSGIVSDLEPFHFQTRSGLLTATRASDWIELDFPALAIEEATPVEGLLAALGIDTPLFVGQTRFDTLVVIESAQQLRSLSPDFTSLARVRTRGIIVTSPSNDPQYDFQSRFFAPAVGINEDPVTGSAHCCLAPYWSERLGKKVLVAYQASKRGGFLRLQVNGDRVILGGQAVTVWQGELLQ
jgi:PhzF family phenazine biosynthesis protein